MSCRCKNKTYSIYDKFTSPRANQDRIEDHVRTLEETQVVMLDKVHQIIMYLGEQAKSMSSLIKNEVCSDVQVKKR